jgi:hypothetical protein
LVLRGRVPICYFLVFLSPASPLPQFTLLGTDTLVLTQGHLDDYIPLPHLHTARPSILLCAELMAPKVHELKAWSPGWCLGAGGRVQWTLQGPSVIEDVFLKEIGGFSFSFMVSTFLCHVSCTIAI